MDFETRIFGNHDLHQFTSLTPLTRSWKMGAWARKWGKLETKSGRELALDVVFRFGG